MSAFTNWKNSKGKYRFCPDCEADLWTASCRHFPMGDAGDAMRRNYINSGELPDKSKVLQINLRYVDQMLELYHAKSDYSWDKFFESERRSHIEAALEPAEE